jgi:hypothetical protein
VIRRATSDLRKERYNLEAFKKHFGDRDADVISLYVAGDLHDVDDSNWYCRSIWVSKELMSNARPASLGGVDLGDGLEVVWNSDYATSSQFYHGLRMDKGAFLTAVGELTANADKIIHEAFANGQINCTAEALCQHTAAMRELLIKSSKVGLPPYECTDVSDRFGDILSIADNAFIYAKNILAERENGSWPYLLEGTLKDYFKNLGRLQYETEKVR